MQICYSMFTNKNTAHTKKGEKKSMADTKNTKSEVGIIGQTYQNRKTKKLGTLESRNEKCKTLCMVDPEGKTFNIVYSTFKSDWRKSVDADTKPVATETKAEKTEPVKDTKKVEKVEKPKKVEKVKLSMEERVKSLMSAKSVLDELVENSKLPLTVKSLSKGGLKVKYNRNTVFELWPHPERENFDFVSVAEVKVSDKNAEHTYRKDWDRHVYVGVKNINTCIKEMISAAKPDIVAKESNKKKKED